MSKLASITVLLFCVAIVSSPRLLTLAQSILLTDKLRATDLNVKPTVLLPCRNPKHSARSPSGDGKVPVTTSANTDLPLNFLYTVSGGNIVGTGPNVTWDLSANTPGEYSIAVRVNDGLGTYSKPLTKTVVLAEPFCNPPCTCPTIGVSSPTVEVGRGGKLMFEARVVGGDLIAPAFSWFIEAGEILSGQDSDSIEVLATAEIGSVITATVNIGGIDPHCNCLQAASESVLIGTKTIARKFEPVVDWIVPDEKSVYIDCPKGERAASDSPKSEDMVIRIQTFARTNSIRDRVIYRYETSAGMIVGSGQDVKWDLTGFQPGLYHISVTIDDGNGRVSATKCETVTVLQRTCTWTPSCPAPPSLSVTQVKSSDDYIVRATSNPTDPGDTRYVWTLTRGKILAGQGSKAIRVRSRWSASEPAPSVVLSLVPSEEIRPYCRSDGESIVLQAPHDQ